MRYRRATRSSLPHAVGEAVPEHERQARFAGGVLLAALGEAPRGGWYDDKLHARHALLMAMRELVADGERIDAGQVALLGKGLSRRGFIVDVDVAPDSRDWSGTYVVLLAHDEADADYPARVVREARVLDWVWPRIRGIRVPRAIALIEDDAPILIASMVTGITVDLRMGRMPIEPWQLVAEAAAAVHAVELPPADVLPDRTRSQHRADLIHELFAGRDDPSAILRDAHAWMLAHVDRPGPAALLHGDLLGQNLHLHPGLELGVIDWEHSEVGDPAHDLAIVARGKRRPFQCPDGRARLLAAYAARAGLEVTSADLAFFELALHVRWFGDPIQSPDASRATLTRLLRER